MRLRAGLVVFLFFLLIAGGCRKPLAPTFDRNLPPETWITAAPLDTITGRESGNRPVQTDPAFIPFRYHLYWAGSDPDGKVVGFYFAVVETLPIPIPPSPDPPPLPGPKARDYRYTTKSDSTFVFSVSDVRSDRQHAFYIYAVDNQGKVDATPARFVFNSIDRYPPLPVIDHFVATGVAWEQDPTTLALTRVIKVMTLASTDTFKIGAKPRVTVPTNSRLDIAWHSEITTVENQAIGYRYRLDEPDYLDVDASVTSVAYNTGPSDAVGPGQKIFRLRALDRAGGARETTRLFQMNIPPITWFAGADPNAAIWRRVGNLTYVDVPNWVTGIPDLAGVSLLSRDSLQTMPSQRAKRKNFLEIYGNRIYLRQERDTVNMNSWVVFFNGGFDADSPYNVQYRDNDPLPRPPDDDTTRTPVLQIRPPNGSPVGFRSRIPSFLTPDGPITSPSQTGLYPIFDPATVFRVPTIATYWGLAQAGQAYFFARAEDGNGQLDARVSATPALQPRAIVTAVDDSLNATPEQAALRDQILTFFVDRLPNIIPSASFVPRPNQTLVSRSFNATMQSEDPDPYDNTTASGVGGPTSSRVFRYSVRFRSPRNGGAPDDSVTYFSGSLDRVPAVTNVPITLPDSLGGTRVRVMIELCDCSLCEFNPGSGRCNNISYLITVPAPPPPPPLAESAASRPGSAIVVEKKRGDQR